MDSLKTNGQGDEIINRLRRGDSYESVAVWLEDPSMDLSDPMSPAAQRKFSQILRGFRTSQSPLPWTRVSKGPALVSHLIRLYMTWIHPIHVLLDEDAFMVSFSNYSDTYCSPALVNVICAMGCHVLYDTYRGQPHAQTSIMSLRNQFMDETRYQMKDPIDYSRTTNIQTFAIMFMVELGNGNGLRASSHLRLAVENLLAKQTLKQVSESGEISTWGILTLHT